MPELKPARREAFATLIAQDVAPERAWIQAGMPGEQRHAKLKADRALKQPEVCIRINELRDLMHRHNVTIDSLTFEYEEARQLAINIEQPSAAVSATTGKAKLHGLDKSDQTNIDNRTIHVMGDVELARRMTMLLERGVNAIDDLNDPDVV
jgi:hypothetical protein